MLPTKRPFLAGSQTGFTLLEVLVALIFFALIGLVLQQVTASTVDQYRRIELKTFAQWIAENKFAELHLSKSLPKAREYKEDLNFANLEWHLLSKVKTTQNPDIHRVEMEVYWLDENEKKRVFVMTGFVGRY
ncbi:MAG: type II secretion system minor pseudopilin GspI [Oleiphilaceae bacterium]|nr:type II secretion system minor pseudopilin GspI [Oleiphilaceae bacterium]